MHLRMPPAPQRPCGRCGHGQSRHQPRCRTCTKCPAFAPPATAPTSDAAPVAIAPEPREVDPQSLDLSPTPDGPIGPAPVDPAASVATPSVGASGPTDAAGFSSPPASPIDGAGAPAWARPDPAALEALGASHLSTLDGILRRLGTAFGVDAPGISEAQRLVGAGPLGRVEARLLSRASDPDVAVLQLLAVEVTLANGFAIAAGVQARRRGSRVADVPAPQKPERAPAPAPAPAPTPTPVPTETRKPFAM